MYVVTVAIPAYQEAFDVSRATASLPYTAVMLGFGVGGMLIGALVDRFGIVKPLLGSTLILVAGLYLAAMVESFTVFIALHAILGACGCAAVFSPILADISRWFVRRRGFAIAICASGNYLAGALWPPLIENTIATDSWETVYQLFGLMSAVVMLPALLVLRPLPPIEEAAEHGGGSAGSAASLGFNTRQLTLLLSIAGIGCCTAMAMPQAHVVALSVDLGFAAERGAQMLSIMFGCGILSRIVFGWLSDRIGGLATLLIGSTLQCLALVMFMQADGLQLLYLAAAFFGLMQGGIVPSYALIVREYFPDAEAASRTGVIIFATLIGMAFGAWSSGFINDLTGSYDLAFMHSIAWNVVNIAIIGMLWLRSRRELQPVSA